MTKCWQIPSRVQLVDSKLIEFECGIKTNAPKPGRRPINSPSVSQHSGFYRFFVTKKEPTFSFPLGVVWNRTNGTTDWDRIRLFLKESKFSGPSTKTRTNVSISNKFSEKDFGMELGSGVSLSLSLGPVANGINVRYRLTQPLTRNSIKTVSPVATFSNTLLNSKQLLRFITGTETFNLSSASFVNKSLGALLFLECWSEANGAKQSILTLILPMARQVQQHADLIATKFKSSGMLAVFALL